MGFLGFFIFKTKDHPLTVSEKYFPKPFVQQLFLEGLSQHPRHPGRWQGLERFELELVYLAPTFLFVEYLDLAQTSKVSYSQIFLRLVMRYQSFTVKKREPCPKFPRSMWGTELSPG